MQQLAGLGTTVVFALAALVWLAYLVPVWTRRREYLATERNAVRLQQTLRIMAETAETPPEVQIAADARDIARQQRLLAKEQRLAQAMERARAVSRARELNEQIKRVEREVRVAVAGSVSRRQRLQRTRLACTLMLLASMGVGVAGVLLPQAALLLALAGVVATLAIGGLVAVNRAGTSLRAVAADERVVAARPPVVVPEVDVELASRTWTPVPVPPQRAQREPIEVLRDTARRIAEDERERVATVTPLRVTFEELVTGEVEPAPERAERPAGTDDAVRTERPQRPAASRYATMGAVDAETAPIDVSAAFRRRVG